MADDDAAQALQGTLSNVAELKEVLDGCDAEISDFVPSLEAIFSHMRIGVPVTMEVGDDGTETTYLSYKRIGKRWRLCTEKGVVGEPEENWTTTPLSDLPREERIEMFERMPAFLNAVVGELQEKIDQRRRVIASTKTLVDSAERFLAHQRRLNNLAEPWDASPDGSALGVFGTDHPGMTEPAEVQPGLTPTPQDDAFPGPPALPKKSGAKFPPRGQTRNLPAGTPPGRKL